MAPPIASSTGFCLRDALMDAARQERQLGHLDIGPVDSLPPQDLIAAQDAFFGPPPPLGPPNTILLHQMPGMALKPLSLPANFPHAPSSLPDPREPAPLLAAAKAPFQSTLRPAGNSATRKRKEQSRSRRRAQRREENSKRPRYGEDKDVRVEHVATSSSTATLYDLTCAPVASTAFVALPDSRGSVRSLEHLVGNLGFRYVEVTEGHRPRAFTDSAGRVVAIYVGAPRDPSWVNVCEEAFEAMRHAASCCQLTPKMKKHRRGNFPAVNTGISHGGGTTEPGNLTQNTPATADAVNALAQHPAIKRIAGFASSALLTWAPRIHAYYSEKLDALLAWKSSLTRLFDNSVFAAAAFNLGPRTVSSKHRDSANIPFGLCAVTALGRFDHKTSAHMVLWELRLVLEFPPTTTILLPSAIVSHSNTPLQPGEERCSFAQYTAGGIVRWIDHGFQPDKEYFDGMTSDDLEQVDNDNEERHRFGISLFSTLTELLSRR